MKPQIDVHATIPMLLAQLNAVRSAKGMPALKSWKETKGRLVAQIARLGVRVAKAPTVVAEGAYRSEREAFARTGHTTNSKENTTMAPAKKTTDTKTKAKKPAPPPTRNIPANAFTLADWARDNGISPKVARARARKSVKALKPFAIDKYIYGNKNRAKVNTILGGKK